MAAKGGLWSHSAVLCGLCPWQAASLINTGTVLSCVFQELLSWDCSPGFYQPSTCVLKRTFSTWYKTKSRYGGRQLLFESLLLPDQPHDRG